MPDGKSNDSVEQRLVDLESRLAHHEQVAEDLSQVVAEQAKVIDMLTLQIRRVHHRIKEVEEGWDRSPQDDRPPPHY